MTKLDTFEHLSEQDYGPWLDRLTLHERDGQLFLHEEFGYSKPYDGTWYVVSRRPEKSLKEAFAAYTSGAFCGTGDKGDLEEELGVELTRVSDPRRPFG